MKVVKIGLIGLGTIGRGVYDVIEDNGRLIKAKTGVSLEIKGVCDTDKKVLKGIDRSRIVSADDLLKDEDIDIIVELIGGVDRAREVIMNALKNGKHVVTANKALLSEYGREIFDAASKNRVCVKFEASVGGGIPVIRTLCESFVADDIKLIYGILNGTTNFILTEMSEKGTSFGDAIKIAQDLGIAEKDPELDISGMDSAHKLAILSMLGFGLDVSSSDIYVEGISNIGPEDIRKASQWGYSVKLLAIAKDGPGGVQLRVHPTLLRSSHLLSDVRHANNAIFIKGDLIGESLLFGKGAGRKPTSSAVVGDIVEIAENISRSSLRDYSFSNCDYISKDKKVSRMEDLEVSFYLRFSVIDKPGVLAGISSVLAEKDISIANVSQEERKEGETVPVVILTHKAREGSMREAIENIDGQGYITAKTVVIRMED